jgi:FHS family L-fucose permease-like MFS transporter
MSSCLSGVLLHMSCMGEQPGLTSSQALLLRANLGAILEAMEQTNATSRFLMPFLVMTALFFMLGFITVLVDALIPRLKEVFELTYLQAGLVQMAWFTAYGVFSIPGGGFIARFGYKSGVIASLVVAGLGCALFYPAADTRTYGLFLLALFVVAGGLAILQVAINPYISVLGSKGGESRRLSLAQAFNSLGTTIAPIVAATYLLSDQIKSSDDLDALGEIEKLAYYAQEASAVQGPFLWLAGAFVALALLVGVIKLPKVLAQRSGGAAQYHEAWKSKRLKYGAIGIFVYVGAEVAIGSYMVNYGLSLEIADALRENSLVNSLVNIAATLKGKEVAGLDPKSVIGALLTFYWGGAMIGRFIGSGLMTKWAPNRLLGVFGLAASAMVLLSITTSGIPALMALLAVGLFNSIMFPTIFTLAIDELGDLKPLGSGILCTAIFGGAIIPPAVGYIADLTGGFQFAFVLPILCYLYIQYYAFRIAK